MIFNIKYHNVIQQSRQNFRTLPSVFYKGGANEKYQSPRLRQDRRGAVNIMESTAAEAFRARLNGSFSGILKWENLDALWHKVKTGQWFFYQIGEALPASPLSGHELAVRIDALNTLLRQDHDYNYCGIVFADNVEIPTLIKVYDPNTLGSSCSCNEKPAPARWIISTAQPALVESHVPSPNNRRRWWQQLFFGG